MIPLRDIRRRISSVRRISHITRAMKTVSAIRLMKVQTQVVKQKPYATKLRELVSDLVQRTSGNLHPLLGQPTADSSQLTANSLQPQSAGRGPIVCLVLGSDRGLCGPFNNNLMAESLKFRAAREGREVHTVVFGKKLIDLMQSHRRPVTRRFTGFYQDMTYDKVAALARDYLQQYLAGRIGELWAVYTEFRSTARQKVKAEQILPIGVLKNDDLRITNDDSKKSPSFDIRHPTLPRAEPLFPEYVYEPDPFGVLDRLLPQYYLREVWRIFLESTASEHMARMLAMDMATINAGDMIRDLTLTFNKARQESITRELSEISTAAEAFRN
jgi:F-type H+-transporting ATPase subunit gamma